MTNDDEPTARLRSLPLRVVVVHDDLRVCRQLADALRSKFVVSVARDAREMSDELGPIQELSCVIGVIGGATRARDIHDQFIGAGGKAERLLLLKKEELQSTSVIAETMGVVRTLGLRRFY